MKGLKEKDLFIGFFIAVLVMAFGFNVFSVPFAAAQEDTQSNAQNTIKMETLTVTAQKKEENVQDVPVSMSVFSDIQLEDSDIQDTTELSRFAPNVYVRDAGNQLQTTIRGVSGFVNALHSASGLYVDDVNLPIIYMQNPKLFDVERVEILKGPQGTLYGRNSESGVINIITKQPDNETRGMIFGEYFLYDTEHGTVPGYRAGGNVSGPIIQDKLYMGIAGEWENSDGYMKNEYSGDETLGEIDRLNGRATLRWTPSDVWDIALIADTMHYDDRYGYGKYIEGPYAKERQALNWDNEDNDWNQDGNGQALRLKYKGESFNFLSVTGRRSYEEDLAQDMDMTPYDLYGLLDIKEEDRIISQELRISSPENHGPLEWLGGIYGFEEDIHFEQIYYEQHLVDIEIKGYAVFGQATYTFFDRLHLTAGLRYDHTDSDGNQTYLNATSQRVDFSKALSNDEILPKFSVTYDFFDCIMTYLSVSKGYLSGGYDYSSATSADNFAYDPEYTWNYEFGIKTSWLEDRLISNLSVYYISMTDKQVSDVNPTNLATTISNAAEAYTFGGELELRARPVRGLDIFAGFGFTEAKIDNWTATEWNSDYTAIIQYDYEGKYLPNAPEYTYNLGAQYRHSTGVFARMDILGTGEFYHDAKNSFKQDSYELVNLKLGYETERFDISLWSKNIFNEEYETVRFEFLSLAAFEGEPRTFGIGIRYHF